MPAANSTGPRSHSPRLWKPKKPWLYQKNPTIVVSTTAATAISSRVRSSLQMVDQRHGAVGIDPRRDVGADRAS